MIVVVRNLNTQEEKIYDYIEDALRDIVDDDIVEERFNEIYPEVDVEGLSFPVGTIYRKCCSDSEWDSIVEEWISIERDYIYDELIQSGEIDYWGYKLIDPSYTPD